MELGRSRWRRSVAASRTSRRRLRLDGGQSWTIRRPAGGAQTHRGPLRYRKRPTHSLEGVRLGPAGRHHRFLRRDARRPRVGLRPESHLLTSGAGRRPEVASLEGQACRQSVGQDFILRPVFNRPSADVSRIKVGAGAFAGRKRLPTYVIFPAFAPSARAALFDRCSSGPDASRLRGCRTCHASSDSQNPGSSCPSTHAEIPRKPIS
ncbi:hypothetical protein SBA4_2040027 [Candidatus Sulfopaludibacter sp. SbA4]|nr:hypothetical protein SBA4_2040027 [Candidatus Sulfopaludibacter sp. SbA4]